MKTFKYRLQPSKSQRTKLLQTLELCRWVYNETLATRKDAWDQEKKSITRFDTIKLLPIWKSENPELLQVHSQVLQDVCTRVDLAFQSFFRRVEQGADKVGYPRFKSYGRYDSFTYPQAGFKPLNNGLFLSKIGTIKIVQHRPIEGKIKTLTIQRDAVGNWYACFVCEVESQTLPANNRSIGVDVGLKSFATLSDGSTVDNPRFFRDDADKLAKAQRRYAKDKTSKRRKVIAHIHQRVANKRRNFSHQVSRALVNEFGVIVLEDLNIKGMLEQNKQVFGHKLNRSIADVAWNQFAQFVSYKAENAGRICLHIDPRGTSQRCSGCGYVVKKDLSVRVHNCPSCGLVIDRDLNAAKNILALGLESIPARGIEAPRF